jgi:arsenate reductase
MKAYVRLSLVRGFPVIIAAGLLLNPSLELKAEEKGTVRTPRTILFVCEHSAAKSAIAAAYFDKLAREQKLNYKASFRGVNPKSTLSTVAAKGLNEDGIDTIGWKPTIVTKSDIDEASEVVTFGCALPGEDVASKVTDWKGISSPSQNYPLARDEIKKRVQRLG